MRLFCAVSRKLMLKRMVNKSREEMPESTDGEQEGKVTSNVIDRGLDVSLLPSPSWEVLLRLRICCRLCPRTDYFDYEINGPRKFDLMVGITRCEELLNATTWTGDTAY